MNLFKKKNPLETQLTHLIENEKDSLYRIAFSYVKNQEDALDIIHDGIVKAYSYLDNVKDPKYLKTWLIRIIINCALDFIRKNKKLVYLEHYEYSDNNNFIENKIQTLDLSAALDTLNDEQKSVIILRFFEDYKISEIAAILRKPESTIKSTLYRALDKLKVNIGKEDAL